MIPNWDLKKKQTKKKQDGSDQRCSMFLTKSAAL